MKYTLIAFYCHPEQIDQTVLASVLEHPESRVEIANGVYVFDTQKGWRDIHQLKSLLTRLKLPFAELPFEQALAGFFPQSTRDKLKVIGIGDDALFNLAE